MSESTVKNVREIETRLLDGTIIETRKVLKVIDGEVREYTTILTESDFEEYDPYDEEAYYPIGDTFPGVIEGGERLLGHQHVIKTFVDGDTWESTWGCHFVSETTGEIIATMYCRGEHMGTYYGK